MSAEQAAALEASKRPRPALGMKGKPAPAFALQSADGRSISREDFAHFPVTVLDFVAANCPFSRKQIPLVEKIRGRYEPMGVRFVNVIDAFGDREYSQDEAVGVMVTLGWQSEVAMDAGNKAGRRFRVTSFPTLFVVDGQGTISEVLIGPKAVAGGALERALDALLEQESRGAAEERKP